MKPLVLLILEFLERWDPLGGGCGSLQVLLRHSFGGGIHECSASSNTCALSVLPCLVFRFLCFLFFSRKQNLEPLIFDTLHVV